MQRKPLPNFYFLLATLLMSIVSCAKAPVERPIQVTVKRGALVIISEPMGANVYVDDKLMGTTPLALKDVPTGPYRVKIELEHHETWLGDADVKHQQTSEVCAKLTPNPGTLEVKSEPNGAKIWIDLKDVGVTPYKGTVAADEEHDVMISTEGYRFEIRRVTVQPEGKEIVSVILEKLKEGEIGPPTIINPKDGAEMILIPAGEFIMGSDKSKDGMAQDNEQPQRKVYLDGYYIYKYEVTVSQYRKFYQETKRQMMPLAPSWGWQDNHPVVNVTWDDAKAYCDWAGVQLPTEAQWEKAARGTDGRIYPWGNEWDNSKYNNINTGPGQTAPVGSYPQGASPYGVMDLAGNVWEWCADWYDGNYYASAPDRNPQGPASGALRLVRGGSWNVDHYYARAAARIGNDPYVRLNDRGFRCSSPRFPR